MEIQVKRVRTGRNSVEVKRVLNGIVVDIVGFFYEDNIVQTIYDTKEAYAFRHKESDFFTESPTEARKEIAKRASDWVEKFKNL